MSGKTENQKQIEARKMEMQESVKKILDILRKEKVRDARTILEATRLVIGREVSQMKLNDFNLKL